MVSYPKHGSKQAHRLSNASLVRLGEDALEQDLACDLIRLHASLLHLCHNAPNLCAILASPCKTMSLMSSW